MIPIALTRYNLWDVVDSIKQFFTDFDWNPFGAYDFAFSKGLTGLLTFVIGIAVLQFTAKVVKAFF